MANSFHASTMLWEVDSTGELTTHSAHLTNPVVRKVVLIPAAASDYFTFTGGGDSETAIYIKSDSDMNLPCEIDFGPQGRRFPNLTADDGSTGAKAYVYLL